jgi:hypothetical protein
MTIDIDAKKGLHLKDDFAILKLALEIPHFNIWLSLPSFLV